MVLSSLIPDIFTYASINNLSPFCIVKFSTSIEGWPSEKHRRSLKPHFNISNTSCIRRNRPFWVYTVVLHCSRRGRTAGGWRMWRSTGNITRLPVQARVFMLACSKLNYQCRSPCSCHRMPFSDISWCFLSYPRSELKSSKENSALNKMLVGGMTKKSRWKYPLIKIKFTEGTRQGWNLKSLEAYIGERNFIRRPGEY